MRVFSIGDLVRIRDWQSMADEFGVDDEDCIQCRCQFIPEMREFCGMEFRIASIDENYIVHGHNLSRYNISVDMIELAEGFGVNENGVFVHIRDMDESEIPDDECDINGFISILSR